MKILTGITRSLWTCAAWLHIYGPLDPRLNALRGDPRFGDLLRRPATCSGMAFPAADVRVM